MDFFGSTDIERMAAEHDYDGLLICLQHRDILVRLQAAQALADMNDGTGWRFLTDTVRQNSDPDSQVIAAAMLGELGHPRAVPVLGEALQKARGEVAEAIRDALEAIPGPEAEEALRKAGYEPVIPQLSHQVTEYEAHYVRPALTGIDQIHMFTAEEHLNTAVDLREAEMTERGLVEDSLALWLSPAWGYAWYLRGVLFEDLERKFEAVLAYRRAIAFDPSQGDARNALSDLEEERSYPPLDAQDLLVMLVDREWRTRRDAAAGLGELGRQLQDGEVQGLDTNSIVSALMGRLEDEDREVRHAVIEALGQYDDRQAILPLLAQEESSWLGRFAILQTLSQLGSVDGLITVLRREMNDIQERNPVFSSHKDPLLEVEYDRMMEIGVRALERTGDVESLLLLAEENTWEVTGDEEDEEAAADGYTDADISLEMDENEVDEDLSSYVDEVAQMAVMALDRLATPRLSELSSDVLKRLAAIPDLTLIDPADEEAEPALVYDLAPLREAAQAELASRK